MIKNDTKSGKVNPIIKAVFTLTAFSAAVKALGFIFRIILSRTLGAEMMGVYSVALSIYYVALTLTSGGLPLVVGKQTAKFRSSGDNASENRVVTAAMLTGIGISLIVSALFLAASALAPNLLGGETVLLILLFLLPGVLASSVHSAFYGSLWGRKSYFTISMIEFVEQVLRIGLCFLVLFLFPGFNKVFSAALSLSLSCVFGAIIAMLVFFKKGGRLKSGKGFFKPLITETAPITGMRLTGSVVNSVIALILPIILVAAGMSNSDSMAAYGAAVGMALPLLFLPSTVVGSLAVALVPELAANVQKKKHAEVNAQIGKAVIFSILVCCVSMPFFYASGDLVGVFLYKNADVGKYLVSATWIMLPVSIEQITSSMMNSLDLELKSYRNYCVTAVILFACIIFLPKYVGMNAYFIGLGASTGAQSVLHVWEIRKKTGFSMNLVLPLLKGAGALVPGAVLGVFLSNILANAPAIVNILVSGIAAVLCSLVMALVLGLAKLPKREKKAARPNGKWQTANGK